MVLCTVPGEAVAEDLAAKLLQQGLIACANLVPGVRSLYLWKGKVEDDREWLMVLKTDEAHYAALEAKLLELHPYDTPEVLALPVQAGAPAYLDWLTGSLT